MQQTAANTFFHNPDFCTLFTNSLLSTITTKPRTLPSTTKPCRTPYPTNPLLTLRGITRSTYDAVMLEHPARVALGLDAQDKFAAGVIVKSLDPKGAGNMWPYVSRSEADFSTFLAREIEDEEDGEEVEKEAGEVVRPKQHKRTVDAWPQRRERIARVFTHHPAATHQPKYDPLDGTTLYITAETFSLCSSLPFARQIFLTQPPQKRIRFGVRYEYSPGTRRYFTLRNEEGIRFGELVDFFEREPEMMKRPYDLNRGLGMYRRWLRDGEFQWMNRLEWEVGRGVVKGGEIWMRASDDGWCEGW
jgi:hypothetical protein